ncbi:hypothetical protein D9615_008167 [Tricholomella constricta]|uniref:Uncharacterized protein n=1 Tax=Tricholomella constricta TaxID=117010 RepID=A0A8H5H335_9AGAR|nr:hypothetical protein D9615_008167 [Tricholomella constricta]
MVDAFGRLPVRYRQWKSFFFKDSYIPTIWVHESTHLVDALAIPVNGARFSQSQTWIDAINLDPKVPDPYSNTNVVEDFAQVANMAMFDRVSPNGISSVEPNWVEVFHQLASAELILSDNVLPGGFCTRRWADSTIVAMPLRTTSDRVAKKPAYMPKNINATNVEEAVIVFESPDMPIIRDTWHHT